MDELLTVNEVADALKLNPQTIRNWIDQGRIPAVRLGPRRVRIRSTDLDHFIAQSGATRTETEEQARRFFDEALAAVQAIEDRRELPPALRRLSQASLQLARSLSF